MHSSALHLPQSTGSTGCYTLEKLCRCLIITRCINTSSLPLISNYPHCSAPDLERIRNMKNKLKQIALKYLNKMIVKFARPWKYCRGNISNAFSKNLAVALFFILDLNCCTVLKILMFFCLIVHKVLQSPHFVLGCLMSITCFL